MGWPWRRRDERPNEPLPLSPSEDDPNVAALQRLQPGDVVVRGDLEFTVQGRVDLEEDGSRWVEFLVDGGGTRCWLGVEPGTPSPVTFWYGIPRERVESGAVGDAELVIGGLTFRRGEKGKASFTATGSTETPPRGSAEWVDYGADDGKLLGCERFGGDWEVHVGEVVEPSELTTRAGATP